MINIPTPTEHDMAMGTDRFLPRYGTISRVFKNNFRNPYVIFIKDWMFNGMNDEKLQVMKPRKGVDRDKALRVIHCSLLSNVAREKKEACCAFMLSQWFELVPLEKKVEEDVKPAA